MLIGEESTPKRNSEYCTNNSPHLPIWAVLIIDLLIERKTMAEIGEILGQHRSMIWRKMQKIKKRRTA